jgi:sugar diacid utilization regulator
VTGRRAASGPVRRAVAMVRPTVAAMADAMTAAVLAEVPAYRQMPPPAREDYRAGLAHVVELFLAMAVSTTAELPVAAKGWLRELGAERARQDLTLSAVLASLQVSMQAGWRHVAATVERSGDRLMIRAAMAELPVVLVRFVAQVEAELVAGYTEGRTGQARRRSELLDDLLAGSFTADEDLLRRAQATGLDLSGTCGLVVVTGPGGAAEITRAGEDVATALPGAITVSMTASQPPHTAIMVPDRSPGAQAHARAAMAKAVAEHQATALVAGWLAGPSALHHAYRQAGEALVLALTVGARGVVHIDELLPDRCLLAVPIELLRETAERTLGRVLALSERDRGALIDTLWALHRHDNATKAAVALAVHEKTVHHRRTRVRELTGLDLDRPADRFRLYFALHALRLTTSNPTGAPDSRRHV